MKTKIINGKVITMDEKFPKVDDLEIVYENDTIIYVGKKFTETVDKIIDAKNKIVMPGLINCHTHLGMSIFRATNDNYSLDKWLQEFIWPIEDKMTDEDMYYTTLLSCLEMIKTGTTCFNDMYFNWKGIFKALNQTKIRGVVGRCLMGTMKDGLDRINDFKEMYKEYNNKNDLIKINVGIHGLYTCDTDYLKECSKLAEEYDLPVHMHLAENSKELEDIKKLHNKEWLDVLKETNLINKKLILAHGTKLNHINELKDKDISICTNPISNLNLGCGIANIKELIDNNINICLGTDGQGSGNNLNLFYHMSLVDYLQKGKYEDPTVMSSYDVLKISTINGAKALGLNKEIGSISIGKKADLIILDLEDITMYPTVDIVNQVVHNAWFNSVKTTIINGQIIYDNNKFNLDIDINNIKEHIKQIRERLI